MITFIIKEQESGRFFGKIKDEMEEDILDNHGNNIECCLSTPHDCINSLLEQYEETK